MAKLFISYRRKSWAFTKQLAERLGELLDAHIFIDFTGMDETDFEPSILRNLRESDAMLVIVTELTFAPDRIHRDDDWVRREISEALTLKKPIVLACVEGLFPPDDLPTDIQGVRGKEGIRFFQEYFENGVQRLVGFITRATPIPPKTGVLPLPPVKSPTSGQHTFDEVETLINDGHYAEAVILLEELRSSGYKSKYVDLEAVIQEIQKARDDILRREEATRGYKEIAAQVRIAKTALAKRRVGVAWRQFCHDYPDLIELLDSQELAKRFEGITVPDSAVTVISQSNSQFTLPLLEWLDIPAGKVALENNAGTFDVKPFAISKYPITYAQFGAFIADNGYREDRWWEGLAQRITEPEDAKWPTDNHPREMVTWYEAIAFCRWLSQKLGSDVILPTEMQWQLAAQGMDGRVYPWGNDFDPAKCNTMASGIFQTTPVDKYLSAASPFQVMDMAGNVMEWCLNEYSSPGYMNINSDQTRSLRGGSWLLFPNIARSAFRCWDNPNFRADVVGFRLVCSVSS